MLFHQDLSPSRVQDILMLGAMKNTQGIEEILDTTMNSATASFALRTLSEKGYDDARLLAEAIRYNNRVRMVTGSRTDAHLLDPPFVRAFYVLDRKAPEGYRRVDVPIPPIIAH